RKKKAHLPKWLSPRTGDSSIHFASVIEGGFDGGLYKMKKAHAMLFKLSQQVENGGANCEDSKRFRLCWKGSHTSMALER
ncbi:MAG TPA: hypothetical protein PKW59_14145, partial [Thermotogota bacterium]|nr:hypothetical protein [Thermotogota bacterium]